MKSPERRKKEALSSKADKPVSEAPPKPQGKAPSSKPSWRDRLPGRRTAEEREKARKTVPKLVPKTDAKGRIAKYLNRAKAVQKEVKR